MSVVGLEQLRTESSGPAGRPPSGPAPLLDAVEGMDEGFGSLHKRDRVVVEPGAKQIGREIAKRRVVLQVAPALSLPFSQTSFFRGCFFFFQ